MKAGDRPPLRQKKGIQVVQSPQIHPKQSTQMKGSVTGSIQSMTRSRGISISRETGITIDKIYDPKHFLPPKSPQFSNKKSEASEMKTLTSVKSLKLVSVFADSNAQIASPIQQIKTIKEELPITQFKIKEQQLQGFQNRCNSPILKLNGGEYQSERGDQKRATPFQKNLLKF